MNSSEAPMMRLKALNNTNKKSTRNVHRDKNIVNLTYN